MEPVILQSGEAPPDGEPYVLHDEATDGLVRVTAMVWIEKGVLAPATIRQPPWPDTDDEGRSIAEAAARLFGVNLYLRRS